MGRPSSQGEHPGRIVPEPAGADAPSGSARPAWLLLAPAMLLLAALATAVDCRLSHGALNGGWLVQMLRHALRVAEPFGHGLGVLLILLCVHQLDPARRWALPRVLAGAWLAGIAANVVKLLVVRVRPHHFAFEGGVWSTFGGWLPLAGAGSGGQSFPSAHTATAVGLAVVLAWLYPRGRYAFGILALLVACQRIAGGAHYLSDVLVGAAIGLVVGSVCTLPCRPWRWTDRWESLRFWRRQSPPA
jgi:membrane-associated phospholipid phosphatase